MTSIYTSMLDFYFIKCPHCQGDIIVSKTEINCGIFRHGIYKNNYQPIDPHLPKNECDRLVSNDLIYGCGKPFKILVTQKCNERSEQLEIQLNVSICDYI